MVVKPRLMRFARITTLSLCLLLAGFVQSCQAAKDSPENIKPLLDPHHHVVDVTGEQPVDIPDFAIVEASVDPVLRRENITDNQAETLRAFCIYEFAQNEYSRYRIFAEELQTGTTYEIQGLPLQWREFTDLVWVTNNILVFDRWSQPHYGVHYAVDVQEKKLLLASPFPDELWLDSHSSR